MKNKYLENFKKVIRYCDYSNTYKMAWARSIVELSCDFGDSEDTFDIDLKCIAEKMFEYYWNQTIFFNLFQSAPNQPPIILQQVKKIIALYYSYETVKKPQTFNKVKTKIETDQLYRDYYNNAIDKCITNIKTYVIDCFLNLKKDKFDFYQIYKKENKITFTKSNLSLLARNKEDLIDLINFRWSLMLEDYNTTPRIGKKVKISDEDFIKRSKLSNFDKFLDLENKEHICFVCGNKIEDDELSRDHVIPWSYMYSDDLWNLVYVHKSCNSVKSDRVPDDEAIKKLKDRNNRLSKEIHKIYSLNKNEKNRSIVDNFDLAIKNDYVEQYYIGCKDYTFDFSCGIKEINNQYYNNNSNEYINKTRDTNMSSVYEPFINKCKKNGKILDVGCGSGRDSLYFIENGYDVYSIDSCEKFFVNAKILGIKNAYNISVEEIKYKNEFDGIWACASLLHIESKNLLMVFNKCYEALKDNGIMYASFKYGDYEGIRDGRYYTDMNETLFESIISKTGFKIEDIIFTSDKLERKEKWFNVYLKKNN